MKRTMIGALAAASLCLPTLTRAQISVQPRGSLWIEGDSTLHKWSSTATVVAMDLRLADGASRSLPEAIKTSKIRAVDVKIPVTGLKSGLDRLDRNLYEILKARKFPDIVYRLERYELVKAAADGVVTAKASGRLTVAGKTKPVTLDVEFRLGRDSAAMRGSCALEMSDYGIKPPTVVFGAIKVRDPVTIRFDLLLTPEVSGESIGAAGRGQDGVLASAEDGAPQRDGPF